MKRITVERVQAAYEATGLKPVRKTTAPSREGIKCACPLAVVAIHETDLTWEEAHIDLLAAHLGVGAGYFSDFLNQVDEVLDYVHDETSDGYQDGLAVRLALWPEAEA